MLLLPFENEKCEDDGMVRYRVTEDFVIDVVAMHKQQRSEVLRLNDNDFCQIDHVLVVIIV